MGNTPEALAGAVEPFLAEPKQEGNDGRQAANPQIGGIETDKVADGRPQQRRQQSKNRAEQRREQTTQAIFAIEIAIFLCGVAAHVEQHA